MPYVAGISLSHQPDLCVSVMRIIDLYGSCPIDSRLVSILCDSFDNNAICLL